MPRSYVWLFGLTLLVHRVPSASSHAGAEDVCHVTCGDESYHTHMHESCLMNGGVTLLCHVTLRIWARVSQQIFKCLTRDKEWEGYPHSLNVTCIVHIYDETRSHVWHDSFVPTTWHVPQTCHHWPTDMSRSHVWHESLIRVWQKAYFHAWHASRVTRNERGIPIHKEWGLSPFMGT